MSKGIFDVEIDLNDLEVLENTMEAYDFYMEYDTGYQDYKTRGYVRCLHTELTEVMGEAFKYAMLEENIINPNWVFNYEFTLEGTLEKLEVKGIKKFEDNYVYFEVV